MTISTRLQTLPSETITVKAQTDENGRRFVVNPETGQKHYDVSHDQIRGFKPISTASEVIESMIGFLKPQPTPAWARGVIDDQVSAAVTYGSKAKTPTAQQQAASAPAKYFLLEFEAHSAITGSDSAVRWFFGAHFPLQAVKMAQDSLYLNQLLVNGKIRVTEIDEQGQQISGSTPFLI